MYLPGSIVDILDWNWNKFPQQRWYFAPKIVPTHLWNISRISRILSKIPWIPSISFYLGWSRVSPLSFCACSFLRFCNDKGRGSIKWEFPYLASPQGPKDTVRQPWTCGFAAWKIMEYIYIIYIYLPKWWFNDKFTGDLPWYNPWKIAKQQIQASHPSVPRHHIVPADLAVAASRAASREVSAILVASEVEKVRDKNTTYSKKKNAPQISPKKMLVQHWSGFAIITWNNPKE